MLMKLMFTPVGAPFLLPSKVNFWPVIKNWQGEKRFFHAQELLGVKMD